MRFPYDGAGVLMEVEWSSDWNIAVNVSGERFRVGACVVVHGNA